MGEISPLVSNASFWDWIDGWSLILVVIGVVGEGVHEWPPATIREWQYLSLLGRLSWLILLAGLAGEFVAQNVRNSDNNLIIAALNDRAVQAEKLAAKLLTDLNTERQKRESRRVSDDQLSTLVSELSKIGGPFFVVCRDEDEPRQYCDRFVSALTNARLIDLSVATNVFTRSPTDNWTGIVLYAPTVSDPNNAMNVHFLEHLSVRRF
jgi:hypothetical protein